MSDDQVEEVNEKIVSLLFVECFTWERKGGSFLSNENIKLLVCSITKHVAVIVLHHPTDADNCSDYHLKNTLCFSPFFF